MWYMCANITAWATSQNEVPNLCTVALVFSDEIYSINKFYISGAFILLNHNYTVGHMKALMYMKY